MFCIVYIRLAAYCMCVLVELDTVAQMELLVIVCLRLSPVVDHNLCCFIAQYCSFSSYALLIVYFSCIDIKAHIFYAKRSEK